MEVIGNSERERRDPSQQALQAKMEHAELLVAEHTN